MSEYSYMVYLNVFEGTYEYRVHQLIRAQTLQEAITVAIRVEAYCGLGEGLSLNPDGLSGSDDWGTREIAYHSHLSVPEGDYMVLKKYFTLG